MCAVRRRKSRRWRRRERWKKRRKDGLEKKKRKGEVVYECWEERGRRRRKVEK